MRFDFIDRWNNIMYMWSNGLLETLPNSYADKISPKSPLKKISLIFKNLFADFLRFFKTTNIPESKIWFLILSHNNFEALKKIQLNVPDSIFVSFFRFRSSVSGPPHYFHLRYRILHDIIYPFKWL